MKWPPSSPIPLEAIREETVLAPFLLQTEGLITDLFAEHLGVPVTPVILEQKVDELGFVRRSLVRSGDLPLYVAVTVIGREPRTRALIQTLRKEPTILFGNALKRHGLYAHKSAPSIIRTELTPSLRTLFGVADERAEAWERSYAIISPTDKPGKKKLAGVTEIFSPKLEELLQRTPAPAA